MIILGITNNDLAGACLVRDGGIVAAASEERFTRQKDHKRPAEPLHRLCVLGEAGIDLADIDRIAYGWNAGFDAGRHLDLYLDRVLEEARERPEGLPHLRKRIADEMANDKAKRGEFRCLRPRQRPARQGRVHRPSRMPRPRRVRLLAVRRGADLTCDGRGDFQSLTVTHYRADGGEAVLQRETSVDSLGYFYGRITRLLGFKPNRHEGKITGLAAFGDAGKAAAADERHDPPGERPPARPLRRTVPALLRRLQRSAAATLRGGTPGGCRRRRATALRRPAGGHRPGARGAHRLRRNLCLAGGVFGNVKLNQRLREIPGVRDVYVLPCMGDGGLALAAAVAVAYRENGTRFPAPSMALGPDARAAPRRMPS
ncbi:carbamoyltransferase N-terminal domain-containing protein [Pseudomonas aeruginosa]